MTTAFKIGVGLTGLLFALLGLRWMLAPVGMAAELGIGLDSVAALSTARGDVGGLFITGAVLCALGLRTGEARWLQACALLVGAVAVGRAIGMVADGFATETLMPFVLELVMVGVLLGAARQRAPAV